MATKLVPVIPRPILDLDTLTPYDFINVDATRYDLLRSDQLSLVQFHRIQQLCPRFDELMAKPTLTEDEEAEMTSVLGAITRLVLRAPDEIVSRLNDFQLLQVVLTFIRISPRMPGRTTRSTVATPPAPAVVPVPSVPPSTGATKSRGSAASTPARRRRRG